MSQANLRNAPPARSDLVEPQPELLAHPLFGELVEPCAERRPRREPGTRIAAVGADKGGDQELDPENLQRARIFVDDIRQYRTAGEINVPLCQGRV